MTARTVALETASIGPDSHGMSRSGKALSSLLPTGSRLGA